MRVLITGAGGFIGGHLCDALAAAGHESVADVCIGRVDVTDAAAVGAMVRTVRPAAIVHLAGPASVSDSWRRPAHTMRVHAVGTYNVLRAAATVAPAARVITFGSSEEYGATGRSAKAPLRESDACAPANPYGRAKAEAARCAAASARWGIAAQHVRPFNLIGPGQRLGFVVPDMCRQIARIERGLIAPHLRVGNLEAVRDFMDVRDAARGCVALLESQDRGAVYNLASGVGTTVRSLLETLLSVAAVRPRVDVDPRLWRPIDVTTIVGNPSRLMAATAWRPRIQLRESLADSLEWWRSRECDAG